MLNQYVACNFPRRHNLAATEINSIKKVQLINSETEIILNLDSQCFWRFYGVLISWVGTWFKPCPSSSIFQNSVIHFVRIGRQMLPLSGSQANDNKKVVYELNGTCRDSFHNLSPSLFVKWSMLLMQLTIWQMSIVNDS